MNDLIHCHFETAKTTNAPTMVLLHGLMGSGLDWHPLISCIPSKFRFLCPDLPGHGKARHNTVVTMPHTAEILIRYLDHSGIRRCILGGYSMGGRLALYLALHYPDRFTGVILESASPGLETEIERNQRRQQDEALAKRLDRMEEGSVAFAEFIEEWYQQPIFSSLLNKPDLYMHLCKQRQNNSPTALANALRGLGIGIQPSLWGYLPKLTLPTLLLAGEEDKKFAGIAERMAVMLPHATLAIINKSGHMPHLENTESCGSILDNFIRIHE